MLQVVGEVGAYGLELSPLEESRPDVPLLEHGDVRPVEELPSLDGQGVHPLQRGELPVDLRVAGPGRLALRYERPDLVVVTAAMRRRRRTAPGAG